MHGETNILIKNVFLKPRKYSTVSIKLFSVLLVSFLGSIINVASRRALPALLLCDIQFYVKSSIEFDYFSFYLGRPPVINVGNVANL